MKHTEPNYNMLFRSAVLCLQQTHNELKKAVMEEVKWQFIDDNGKPCILAGYEERARRVSELMKEVDRLRHDVEHYRNKLDG